MRHIGNNTNFQRLLKLVFTSFSTKKNIMDTIEEGILNALVCSAPNLQKLEIRHFGNKPFNCVVECGMMVKGREKVKHSAGS